MASRQHATGCPTPLTAGSIATAEEAGLVYVSDTQPGIRRLRAGGGFRYLGPGGPIRDSGTLARIKKLAIPPAWTDVWISPTESGHIQASGRDARGRKQYRYHERWREVRDRTKYERMVAFGRALPRIRRRVERDLSLPGLPREKVLATVVSLLEATRIRVGNREYADENKSYGLTTFRNKHAEVNGSSIRFEFLGKSGKKHSVTLRDRRLAKVVRRCQEIKGQELFQYLDDAGERRQVGSADVNEYLRDVSGEEFSAKDFRTWAGTVLAAQALRDRAPFESEAEAKRELADAIEAVAKSLGNTAAICRRCYIHPEVIGCFLEGGLADLLQGEGAVHRRVRGLKPDEQALLALLEARSAVDGRRGRERPGKGTVSAAAQSSRF